MALRVQDDPDIEEDDAPYAMGKWELNLDQRDTDEKCLRQMRAELKNKGLLPFFPPEVTDQYIRYPLFLSREQFKNILTETIRQRDAVLNAYTEQNKQKYIRRQLEINGYREQLADEILEGLDKLLKELEEEGDLGGKLAASAQNEAGSKSQSKEEELAAEYEQIKHKMKSHIDMPFEDLLSNADVWYDVWMLRADLLVEGALRSDSPLWKALTDMEYELAILGYYKILPPDGLGNMLRASWKERGVEGLEDMLQAQTVQMRSLYRGLPLPHAQRLDFYRKIFRSPLVEEEATSEKTLQERIKFHE